MSVNKNPLGEDYNVLLEQYAPILKNLIRFSSAVNAKDISFYKSIDTEIKNKADTINSHLVETMNDILMSALTVSNDSEDWKFQDDFEQENNQILSNVLDILLEKVELNLDNHYKAKKNNRFISNKPSNYDDDTNNNNNDDDDDDSYTYLDKNGDAAGQSSMPKSNPNMEKPQDRFHDSVNNFEKLPFKPLIKTKPNSMESLENSLQLIESTEDVPEHYNNPYSYEIMNAEYPDWILNQVPESERYESIPWVGSPEAQWIETPQQLDSLLVELNKCKVIAIDLEHHDYRTYHGLTCLMQITTDTKKDYLIDPLSPDLRPHLTQLNLIFTNPQIIKVLHGAFMDVIWLQRDLGLYLVSLFDTFHAAKQLSLGKYSLAFLLEEYVRFRTSKKWQLADWRIRPLSNEMRDYAKADTHFLIEVFYKMHDELLKIPNALQKALYASRKVAIRRFEYPTYRPKNLSMSSSSNVVTTSGSVPLIDNIMNNVTLNYDRDLPWTNLIFSNGIPLEKRPLLETLYKWRDIQARENDESPRFIMSDFILVSLANNFEIGHEDAVNSNSVMAVINKTAKFGGSYFIRKSIKNLTEAIKNALIELKGIDLNKLENISKQDDEISDNSSIAISSSTMTDIGDIYASVKNVSKLQEEFNAFNQFYNKNIFDGNDNNTIININENSDKSNDVFAVLYNSKGDTKFVKNNAVGERINEVIEHLTEDMGKNVEFIVEAEEEIEDKVAEDEADSVAAGGEGMDQNEIITLRKRNDKGIKKNKRKADESSEKDLSVDFTKSIMEQEEDSGRRSKKQKKKPSFDPYSALNDKNIPMLKKRERVDRGKNVVFKKSKK